MCNGCIKVCAILSYTNSLGWIQCHSYTGSLKHTCRQAKQAVRRAPATWRARVQTSNNISTQAHQRAGEGHYKGCCLGFGAAGQTLCVTIQMPHAAPLSSGGNAKVTAIKAMDRPRLVRLAKPRSHLKKSPVGPSPKPPLCPQVLSRVSSNRSVCLCA